MHIKQLHESFCMYQETMRGFNRSTVTGYKQVFQIFLNYFSEVETIDQVSVFDVEQFFYWGRAKRKWSTNTFITYHKRLNVFFQYAVDRGVIEVNPFANIEKPRLDKKLPKRLTRQQAMILLEAAYNMSYDYRFLRYRNHAIFAMFLYCGLRKNELLKLKMTAVDLDNATIHVFMGKGNKDRVVPMPQPLMPILEKYLQERRRLKKTCPEFFTSMNRDMGFTENGLKHLVDRLKEETGIYFYIHALRHTFATLMIEGGCDIYSLSKMLGHNDIKTTTIYLSASTEHLRSQIKKHPLNVL